MAIQFDFGQNANRDESCLASRSCLFRVDVGNISESFRGNSEQFLANLQIQRGCLQTTGHIEPREEHLFQTRQLFSLYRPGSNCASDSIPHELKFNCYTSCRADVYLELQSCGQVKYDIKSFAHSNFERREAG
jgi:hypothetical protein